MRTAKLTNYLWHFGRLPREKGRKDEDFFDHSHWWNDPKEDPEDPFKKVSLAASLWEICRRHPRVKSILRPWKEVFSEIAHWNDVDQFLSNFATQSWPKLGQAQAAWELLVFDLPSQRGHVSEGIHEITCESIDIRRWSPDGKLKHESGAPYESVRADELGLLAAKHHKAGRIIVAIDVDLNGSDVEMGKLLRRCIAAHRGKALTIRRGRAHPLTALRSISEFEHAHMERHKSSKKNRDLNGVLFRDYCRTIGSVLWPDAIKTQSITPSISPRPESIENR